MKKFIALILSLVLVLSLAACGGNKEDSKNDSTDDIANNTASSHDEISVSDIVTQTASASDIEFYSFMTEAVDRETVAYLVGTESVDTDFVEAVAHVPMMNTNPFTMIVFRTADEATAQTLADELESKANLGKLVCVLAETADTVVSGKTVLFIMGSQSEVDAIINAFNAL